MKKIAIYLRLSLADKDLGVRGKEESNSIENQRLLIRNYLESNEQLVGEVIEYRDDGYSGLSFNRPAFRQMIEDAKRGVIGTIIVKDLSRLGRDYISVGDYMEQIFPSLGVRLIAINSKYDSSDHGADVLSLDASINNMINNMYSRDLSKKLRSSFRAKWNSGQDPAASIPFGYRKDKRDEDHRLIIDEEAAAIVRTIFALANQGKNSKSIAEHLNSTGVPTPLMYNHLKYGIRIPAAVQNEEEQLWNTHKVLEVIKRIEYTGARAHGKQERIGIGNGKVKKTKEQDWVIVEDDHPAIITKEDYYLAQLIIQRKKEPQNWNSRQDAFSKKLRCGCCGCALQAQDYDGNILYCQHASDIGSKSKCNRDTFDKRLLQTAVLHSLKNHLSLLSAAGAKLKETNQDVFAANEKTASTYRAEVKRLSDELAHQYESYVNGHLPREKFVDIKKNINEERSKLESVLGTMEQKQSDSESIVSDIARIVNLEKRLGLSEKLPSAVIDALIDRVYVYEKDKLEIKFRFADLFERANDLIQKAS